MKHNEEEARRRKKEKKNGPTKPGTKPELKRKKETETVERKRTVLTTRYGSFGVEAVATLL